MKENSHGWVIYAIALNIHMKKKKKKILNIYIYVYITIEDYDPTQISIQTTLY